MTESSEQLRLSKFAIADVMNFQFNRLLPC